MRVLKKNVYGVTRAYPQNIDSIHSLVFSCVAQLSWYSTAAERYIRPMSGRPAAEYAGSVVSSAASVYYCQCFISELHVNDKSGVIG